MLTDERYEQIRKLVNEYDEKHPSEDSILDMTRELLDQDPDINLHHIINTSVKLKEFANNTGIDLQELHDWSDRLSEEMDSAIDIIKILCL